MNARQEARHAAGIGYTVFNPDTNEWEGNIRNVWEHTKDGTIQEVAKSPISPRQEILATADSLVNGDRNVDYGDPNDDFRRTAIYWSTHAGGVLRRKMAEQDTSLESSTAKFLLELVDSLFDPHDVAIMMMQLKNSRMAWSPEKKDNWIDSAGYAACGYDCTTRSST